MSVNTAPPHCGSSSLLGVNPRMIGPRGPTEPVVSSVHRHPALSSSSHYLQPSAGQRQPQQRQPQSVPWRFATPQQPLWPPPPRSAPAPRNTYQNDSSSSKQSWTVVRGGRGRGGVPARPPPASTLAPRSADKTHEIRTQLLDVFPHNAREVDIILKQNRHSFSVDELCLKVSDMV